MDGERKRMMLKDNKETGKDHPSNISRKRAVTAITFYVTADEKAMLLSDAKLYGGTSNCIRLQLGLAPNAAGRKSSEVAGEVVPFLKLDELD